MVNVPPASVRCARVAAPPLDASDYRVRVCIVMASRVAVFFL